MTSLLAYTLPLQLVYHLIIPRACASSNSTNYVTNQPPLKGIRWVTLTELLVETIALLGFISLDFAWQWLVTKSSGITQNVTLGKTTTPIRPVNLPEGYTSFLKDHAAYQVYYDYLLWHEARDRCILKGAHLAVVDSIDKLLHINSLKYLNRQDWLHIGIYRSNITNEMVRIDNGLLATSVPWSSFDFNPHGNCTGITYSEYRVSSYSCYVKTGYFVCEIAI